MPRTPDEDAARDCTMCTRVKDSESKAVERARGTQSRSAFMREAIRNEVRKRGEEL